MAITITKDLDTLIKWIPFNLPFGPIWAENFYEEMDSFNKRELDKPGTLIEVEKDGQRIHYLIGHVDQLLGNCGHCKVLYNETTIIRYAVCLTFTDDD